MKKLFKNKSIVTIVALAICLVIIFFAYRYRVNKAINAVGIPIATRTINSREKITANDYKIVNVATAMITGNVIVKTSYIEDRYVNYNTIIPEGSMFYSNAVVDWESMPDSTWASINNNNTIVSIKVNATSTFGNSIYPNDTIDLYYQNRTPDGQLFIGKLIEGIKVLAVKDENGQHVFKRSSEQANEAALIFSVTEDLHLLLRKAEFVSGGKIIPVPRNLTYSSDEEQAIVKSDYIKTFIENRAWDLRDDYIANNTETIQPTVTE